MKTRYILLAFAALAISACARNVEPAEPEGIQMTFTAYQEGAAPTKSTVLDGGTQVYWEPGDEIKVFFNGSSGRFISQNTENATSATFTGMLPVVVGGNEGAGITTKTWGLYPYRADAVLDGDAMVTTLPAAQTGRAGSFAKNTNITLAHSEGYGLAFYNVCGGLRFSLTQEGIKRITFEGNNGEALAGKIKIAFEDGVPVVSEVVAKDSVLTLTAPNGGTFQTGVWYYLSAIPGTLSGGYKMVFYKESESAKLTSTSSVRIKRGIFGSLADADEDLVFKPTGGGDEPNPDDVIQFADPIAKYACVEKFDTNSDGEVSYAEAAAATNLDNLFANYNTVTSFDEIAFFTGAKTLSGTFTGCSKLTHIAIPEWVTTLSNNTFQNCSSLESVILPSTLSSLTTYCFSHCSALTEIELPNGITSIPRACFSYCISLSNISLPSELSYIDYFAFESCSSLTSIILPESLTYIGSYAFEGCWRLVSVILPENLTRIPDHCFESCSELSITAWPQALTTIGESAFENCRFARANYTVQLPSSITSIGSKAFSAIRHLILPSTSPVTIMSNSVSEATFLYVPANMVEMYKVRTNWSDHADYIRPIGDYPVMPVVGGTVGEAVDLGLSVKWASWNVGSSAPGEVGSRFAWGETTPRWDFDIINYKWCNGSYETLTKYNTMSEYGIVDNKTTLEPQDDAAHIYWGGAWRMPTKDEFEELVNNCTREWGYENDSYGCHFISKKTGYTDKSVFLPYLYGSVYNDGSGYYWTSTLCTNGDYPTPNNAYELWLYNRKGYGALTMSHSRYGGLPIRPVCE